MTEIAGWREAALRGPHAGQPTRAGLRDDERLGAAVPNVGRVETRQAATEAQNLSEPTRFPMQAEIEGPCHIMPDRPGLGLEVDEAALRACAAAR